MSMPEYCTHCDVALTSAIGLQAAGNSKVLQAGAEPFSRLSAPFVLVVPLVIGVGSTLGIPAPSLDLT
jgi:hypothetical protein